MKYLGIDQSFTSCGLVVIDDYSQLIYHSIVKSNPKDTVFKRAWDILKAIEKILVEYQVNYIAIEGLAFAKIGNATRSLAILQGVLVSNLQYNPPVGHKLKSSEIPIISPSMLKKYATGKGKATKLDMIKALPLNISQQWSTISIKNGLDDLADAYHISFYLKTHTKPRYIFRLTLKSGH